MTPDGPYIQAQGFASGDWYIVSDWQHNQEVFVIVQNGKQRSDGVPSLTLRDARSWMRDNGFVLKPKKKGLKASTGRKEDYRIIRAGRDQLWWIVETPNRTDTELGPFYSQQEAQRALNEQFTMYTPPKKAIQLKSRLRQTTKALDVGTYIVGHTSGDFKQGDVMRITRVHPPGKPPFTETSYSVFFPSDEASDRFGESEISDLQLRKKSLTKAHKPGSELQVGDEVKIGEGNMSRREWRTVTEVKPGRMEDSRILTFSDGKVIQVHINSTYETKGYPNSTNWDDWDKPESFKVVNLGGAGWGCRSTDGRWLAFFGKDQWSNNEDDAWCMDSVEQAREQGNAAIRSRKKKSLTKGSSSIVQEAAKILMAKYADRITNMADLVMDLDGFWEEGHGSPPVSAQAVANEFVQVMRLDQRPAFKSISKSYYHCEICGKKTDEFGDVDGAIVCGDCLGWGGKKPTDPFVIDFLRRNGEIDQAPDNIPAWPPRSR